ncbi:uncharacterized protein RCC_02169 [Ramularia collo-cygni]|uniref:Uncharacterized protein n=1 Tax=Ramularia collo-cygni TaxID=112498 RepID=A0A2D3UVY2_9PEZI|nr:uncharacterized protein RCC_02169 [Ramularia collo-cygni]CZT16327.1 uncharacterized protein RCC_02169 [Ramularia collo-cygni]
MASPSPAYSRIPTNTRTDDWTSSRSSSSGDHSNESPSPTADSSSPTASSVDPTEDKKSVVSECPYERYFSGLLAPVPNEYLLSVRASNGSFFPIQVSSTLLWRRSGWFKKEMSKPSSTGSTACSTTGLRSFYATDSVKGKMITAPFTTAEELELYIGLLTSGKVRRQLFNQGYSPSTMDTLVQLYFCCVNFEDPTSAELVLEEVALGLTRFSDDESLNDLANFIWSVPADGMKEEMRVLRRQFKDWGLRTFSWVPAVNEWMEDEGKGPDDLVERYTSFHKDVIVDYWMNQE